jgi:RNA polymerase-binding transcription factor DksA
MTMRTTQSSLLHEESLDAIRISLDAASDSRERQLDALPPTHGDLVADAHRRAIGQTLMEIRAARQRLESGRFGLCQRCETAIPIERLELRPWTPLCVPCAAGEVASHG